MSRSLLARRPVSKLYHSFASTNVTTGAWVEVEDSLPAAADAVEIFNGCASTLKIATGAAASETELDYYILPGGSSILLPWNLAKGVRIAIRAQDTNATTGTFVMNFFA